MREDPSLATAGLQNPQQVREGRRDIERRDALGVAARLDPRSRQQQRHGGVLGVGRAVRRADRLSGHPVRIGDHDQVAAHLGVEAYS